jgi:hypothetical protein
VRLHSRACLVASEVRALLASGHPFGAQARWRTLHELGVVAFILRMSDKEVAERYLLHEVAQADYNARDLLRLRRWFRHAAPTEDKYRDLRRRAKLVFDNLRVDCDTPHSLLADRLARQEWA